MRRNLAQERQKAWAADVAPPASTPAEASLYVREYNAILEVKRKEAESRNAAEMLAARKRAEFAANAEEQLRKEKLQGCLSAKARADFGDQIREAERMRLARTKEERMSGQVVNGISCTKYMK